MDRSDLCRAGPTVRGYESFDNGIIRMGCPLDGWESVMLRNIGSYLILAAEAGGLINPAVGVRGVRPTLSFCLCVFLSMGVRSTL